MQNRQVFILGISFILGVFVSSAILGNSLLAFKELDRTVSVKGLAEKEVQADKVLWPILYLQTENELASLYTKLEQDTKKIISFLKEAGFTDSEITVTAPLVVDKIAQDYGGNEALKYRYGGTQTISVLTNKIKEVQENLIAISDLGKSGITFKSDIYENKIEYYYTQLNLIKPQMIEEATQNARASALKFAEDSHSKLGKIKQASQGQFSVSPRDKYTPYLMKVRVVSTVEYYLND